MAGRLITRDDVIRAGACVDGVYKWAEQHVPDETAVPAEVALKLCGRSKDLRAHILRALGQDGDGDGYGYGYGDGYGDGDGDGGYRAAAKGGEA